MCQVPANTAQWDPAGRHWAGDMELLEAQSDHQKAFGRVSSESFKHHDSDWKKIWQLFAGILRKGLSSTCGVTFLLFDRALSFWVHGTRQEYMHTTLEVVKELFYWQEPASDSVLKSQHFELPWQKLLYFHSWSLITLRWDKLLVAVSQPANY